jgi:hypothetical protein
MIYNVPNLKNKFEIHSVGLTCLAYTYTDMYKYIYIYIYLFNYITPITHHRRVVSFYCCLTYFGNSLYYYNKKYIDMDPFVDV